MIFKPNIDLKNICFKYIDENEITFEVDVLFKHNFLAPITIDSLSGDLYIVNEETKITSKDKIGKFICYDSFILEHGKENIIKLDLKLYYVDIFFSNIVKTYFNVEYKIDIDISGKFLSMSLEEGLINKFIKKATKGKINLIKLLKNYLK